MRPSAIFFRACLFVFMTGSVLWLNPDAPSLNAAEPVKAGAAKKQPGQPMVVIVAQRDYPEPGQKLTDATKDAAQLAIQLAKANYKVELIIDQGSEPEARDALKAGKFEKNVTVVTSGEATALEKELRQWMAEAANAQAPLALMVLSGHGIERDKTPYFLTVGDDPMSGGLSMASLRTAASACAPNGLYLAMVYDACRSAPLGGQVPAPLKVVGEDGKPIALPKVVAPSTSDSRGNFDWVKTRERKFELAVEAKASNGKLVPTILYSTQAGRRAVASHSLVFHLAEALRDQKALATFLELMAGERKGHPDLVLYDWFHFAVARLQASSDAAADPPRLAQAHELRLGAVPLTQVVVRRENGHWAATRNRETFIDLLTDPLSRDMGELEFVFQPRLGVRITRPNQNITAPWAGFAVGPQSGIDPTEKVLELDVLANLPNEKPGKGSMTFIVNPVNRESPTKHINLVHGNGEANSNPLTIARGYPFRLVIPLRTLVDENQKVRPLNGLALASTNIPDSIWPNAGSVTVIGLRVVSQRRPRPLIVPQREPLQMGDLLPGAWAAGESTQGDPCLKLVALDQTKDTSALYRLEPEVGKTGNSRCSGELIPPRYIPPGYLLQLDAWSKSGKAELIVDLVYKDAVTGLVTPYVDRESVRVGVKGSPPIKLLLNDSGFANIFRLTTSAPDIHIKSIRIVPSKDR